MSTQAKPRLTPEEYLEIERKADHKSEYYDGQMYTIAGASANHVTLAVDLLLILGNQFGAGAGASTATCESGS